MKKLSIIIILLILAVVGCTTTRLQEPTVEINGHTFKVEVVDDKDSRTIGLSKYDSLETDQGMLFVYPEAKATQFWMKNMKFPIDLLWIDGNKIVGYEKNMQVPEPDTLDKDLEKYAAPALVDKVFEARAGIVEELNIKVGDIIEINI